MKVEDLPNLHEAIDDYISKAYEEGYKKGAEFKIQALKEEVEDLQPESESCDYHDGIHDALVLIEIYKNGKET